MENHKFYEVDQQTKNDDVRWQTVSLPGSMPDVRQRVRPGKVMFSING